MRSGKLVGVGRVRWVGRYGECGRGVPALRSAARRIVQAAARGARAAGAGPRPGGAPGGPRHRHGAAVLGQLNAPHQHRHPAFCPPRQRNPAAPAAAVAAPVAVDPGLIDRFKVPSNTVTLTAEDFDHSKSSSLTDALLQRVPSVYVNDSSGNPFQPRRAIPRLSGVTGGGRPARPGGLSERRAHQRGLRRHGQLGLHPGRRDQAARRPPQQPGVRAQCARRRHLDRDEERLQLSGSRGRAARRLVLAARRPGSGRHAAGQRRVLRLRRCAQR